jgi:hypothetical protein
VLCSENKRILQNIFSTSNTKLTKNSSNKVCKKIFIKSFKMCCYSGTGLNTGLSAKSGFLYDSKNLNDIVTSG